MKLTKSEIDHLTCPRDRADFLVFDDEIPGFGLRVTAKGTKTFLLQYQLGGRRGPRQRLTIGKLGELTPAQARKRAEFARSLVLAGRDPRAELKNDRAAAAERKRQAEHALTLDGLIENWAKIALADRSPSHRREAPRALRAVFATVLTRPADALDGATVQRLLDDVAASRPTMARRARDYGRAAFGWAIRRKLAAANPFAAVAIEAREISRDRVLTDVELGEAWRAAITLGLPYGPLLQLALLTLQRRGEVAGLRWRELSADFSTWTIPAARAKNRKEHIVHLAEPARAILREIPRDRRATMVFLASGAANATESSGAAPAPPLSGFSAAKLRLVAAIALERAELVATTPGADRETSTPDWRVHDFRRTGVTVLARLGIAPHVADLILNHVPAATIRGVAAVYQRHQFLTERARALDAWAGHVIGCAVGDRRPNNVVHLRTLKSE